MIVLRTAAEPKVGMQVSFSDKPPVMLALTRCDDGAGYHFVADND
jgi:hypothetical protein